MDAQIDARLTDAVVDKQGREVTLTQFQSLLRQAVEDLTKALQAKDEKLTQGLRLTSLKDYYEGETSIYELVNNGWMVTADWSVTRDPLVPDLSTITAIAEAGLGEKTKIDFTFNAGFNFYNAKSTQVTRNFHSFKATSQLDVPLGKFGELGPFVLALAGRYQDIPNRTVTPGSEVLAAAVGDTKAAGGQTGAAAAGMTAVTPEGRVGIGQIKLIIPMKDSGVKVPLSFSVSNRAGLVQEKTSFSATVGLTFDLDAMFGRSAAK
ncbi:MAG: hypothetical protein FJW31_21020 [Acidobacteria bacterium]|nr:hypothetical protein [Acidobacteriota bacterium]